ncbi:MAG TPA: TIR domain-containing protein [Actinophytocola sp.]|uniref:TIR domain-containing protein n=1 Tax=Actinophytocola sp. TaxID=1872138 RepID=UPI002DDDAFE0|nr:TIR domain-containing protein [Actinophytocola sp.]HEV2780201.1 TIR domain-containing protein [Actinophytocola sp.]
MAKTRVFISFDYDHDDDLRILLLGQAKLPGSPFEIADWSLKEPLIGNWKEKIKPRIRAVSQVAVICGHYTNTATGVSAEVEIARSESKPYFLLAGRATGTNRKPTSALSTDQLYNWTWENLKTLIAGGR